MGKAGNTKARADASAPKRRRNSPEKGPADLPSPDWSSLEAKPAARVRDLLFYLLNVSPRAARDAGVHDVDSEHPLAFRYNELLKIAAQQILVGNPCMKPLLGPPALNRKEFQVTWLSVSHFVALARSAVTPFQKVVGEIPEELRDLVPSPSFLEKDSTAAIREYEKAASRRKPSALPTTSAPTLDESDGVFDPDPATMKKGERYAYPTLGLLAELLEDILAGEPFPPEALHAGKLNAEALGAHLHKLAGSEFPKSIVHLKRPDTIARHISAARRKLKTGNFE